MSQPLPSDQVLFTCLSCSIAFLSAEDQRAHYRSDHHRYNMKRRVASLPPVSAHVFDQKVIERRAETAVMASSKGSACDICNKFYTTEGAYRSHLNSKKHKENELKVSSSPTVVSPIAADIIYSQGENEMQNTHIETAASSPALESTMTSLVIEEDASDDQINQTIDEKIAAARARLSPSSCLFCPQESASFENNLTHMSLTHSFFIPDAEYLIDVTGLVSYLGEKIAVGNICIYCNGKGREFRTLGAVRKHMVDKSHCKIAYESSNDRLEISDYYDFTSSYPDAQLKIKKRGGEAGSNGGEVDDWEDLDSDDNEDIDEVVEGIVSDNESGSDSDSDSSIPENQITYGDSHLELVLPSGIRIGHRTMRRYYAQSFPGGPRGGASEDLNSGAALVRRLIADRNSALVPRKGGFGAFGIGSEVVKARNRGEAREAGRHVREFRDQKRREDFKTKVAYIHNSQKHFRDPCKCSLLVRVRPLNPILRISSWLSFW